MRAGHQCVVSDLSPQNVNELAGEGATGSTSLDDFVAKLTKPRAAWIMVPAGDPTEQTVNALSQRFQAGDIIIDGGNSYYKDDVRRSQKLKDRGIHYIDVGTSGGVWGLERGYCMMLGGPKEAVEHLDPIFKTLAPGKGDIPKTPGREKFKSTAEEGYLYCGPSGAGHFVKMVHNGIEYGLMQAYAEGFSILRHKSEFAVDLHQVAEIWRHGSVVRSWLLDLTSAALEKNPSLEGIAPYVADSGEGRWTVAEAIELDVAAPAITLSLLARLRSRDAESFSDKLLSAMRHQFGGHEIKKE
jgi:6-phosphogluconate dehydrogenase